METKIGFVTIGQSPRDDIVPEIAQLLSPGVLIIETGALDGLSKPEIQSLAPEKRDFPLITRLRDGSSVVVGRRKIIPLLLKQIHGLVDHHVRLSALLCTDEFPRLGPRKIGIQPSRLLFRLVVSSLKEGKLGVFVPLESQKRAIRRKWQKTGLDVVVAALNPYRESSELAETIKRMRSKEVDLVVLDCIGYSLRTAKEIGSMMGKPVLCPRAVLASAIKELI